jgi:hypothetical protein
VIFFNIISVSVICAYGLSHKKHSEEAAKKLSAIHGEKFKAFSLDISDRYFAVDMNEVIEQIGKRIEDLGEIEFKKKTGFEKEQFISLFKLYINSTFACRGNLYYSQKG